MTDDAKKTLDLLDGSLVGTLARAGLYVSTVAERHAELTETAELRVRCAETASLRAQLEQAEQEAERLRRWTRALAEQEAARRAS